MAALPKATNSAFHGNRPTASAAEQTSICVAASPRTFDVSGLPGPVIDNAVLNGGMRLDAFVAPPDLKMFVDDRLLLVTFEALIRHWDDKAPRGPQGRKGGNTNVVVQELHRSVCQPQE